MIIVRLPIIRSEGWSSYVAACLFSKNSLEKEYSCLGTCCNCCDLHVERAAVLSLLLDGFDGGDGAHWSSIELPYRASKKVALSSVGCDVRDSNGSTGARKPKVCGDIFSMHG